MIHVQCPAMLCLAALLMGVVCGFAHAAERTDRVMLYSYHDIANVGAKGMSVPEGGEYSVWVWAPEKSFTHVSIGGTRLPPAARKKPTPGFSWMRLGSLRLEPDQHFGIKIEGGSPPKTVGYVALALDREYKPSQGFELGNVFTDSPGAAADRRLTAVRHTDSFFSFPLYTSERDREERAVELRRQMLVAAGLWPMPEKCPLNANMFDRTDRGNYTVEKVYFESYPGFYVTGNLYRPAGKTGPFPAIACPHGHWGRGRLENTDQGSVPGRCITFARQGYVVFSYDMVGYNDSKQVEHRFGGTRETMWAIHPLGLQLWNSIRVLDFLSSLPDVDPDRLGCTGASGGGTQTFLLMAVDDRVKVAAPVNMISAHFQGGCLCENAPGLRFGTHNVEFGAMMAPRPLLLVSATGDWTDETPRVEYPAVRSVYELFGAEDRVHYVQIDAGHNYNRASREAVYAWFGKWLLKNAETAGLEEEPFAVEKDEDLLVFAGRELPHGAVTYEELVDEIISEDRQLLEARRPKDQPGLARFRDLFVPALEDVLGVEVPEPNDITVERTGRTKRSSFWVERLLIGRRCYGDQIPAVVFLPVTAGPAFPATLIVHAEGKAALVDMERGEPEKLVGGLLERGHAVMAVDPFLIGEYNSPFERARRERKGNYFTTFNPTDDALRVQDVLTSIVYLKDRRDVQSINVVGLGDAGIWCLLAAGLKSGLGRVAADLAGFDPESEDEWQRRAFVPGICRLGGLRTAATLAAPVPLYTFNAHDRFDAGWVAEAYRAAGDEHVLKVDRSRPNEEALIRWLDS
jgi:dienelactone hydrolase